VPLQVKVEFIPAMKQATLFGFGDELLSRMYFPTTNVVFIVILYNETSLSFSMEDSKNGVKRTNNSSLSLRRLRPQRII
jgi:hypothetical protein